MKKLEKITSEEFDRRFDEGEDMGDFLDTKKAKVNRQTQRINSAAPGLKQTILEAGCSILIKDPVSSIEHQASSIKH